MTSKGWLNMYMEERKQKRDLRKRWFLIRWPGDHFRTSCFFSFFVSDIAGRMLGCVDFLQRVFYRRLSDWYWLQNYFTMV